MHSDEDYHGSLNSYAAHMNFMLEVQTFQSDPFHSYSHIYFKPKLLCYSIQLANVAQRNKQPRHISVSQASPQNLNCSDIVSK